MTSAKSSDELISENFTSTFPASLLRVRNKDSLHLGGHSSSSVFISSFHSLLLQRKVREWEKALQDLRDKCKH